MRAYGADGAWSVTAGGTAIKGKSICWSYPATLALNRTRQSFGEAYVQLKRATVDHGSRNPTAPAYLGDTLHSQAAVRLWLQKQLQDRDWKPYGLIQLWKFLHVSNSTRVANSSAKPVDGVPLAGRRRSQDRCH